MNYARICVAQATNKVGAASYLPGGVVTAPKFSAKLLVAEKLGASPTSASFRPITGEIVPCFNVLDEEIDAGQIILIGQGVDETWVVECKY